MELIVHENQNVLSFTNLNFSWFMKEREIWYVYGNAVCSMKDTYKEFETIHFE